MLPRLCIVTLALLLLPMHGEAEENNRNDFFSIPSPTELPFNMETLAETEPVPGVVLSEIYITGAPFNGEGTRIYAFYARPKGNGPWPGVVQLHGSGLVKLLPDPAIGYAKAGYACICIDWAGVNYRGDDKFREKPYSEFKSKGTLAVKDASTGKWIVTPPEQDPRANGIKFIRRALQFLRSRPEVDSDKLCISGMSAGAQATLGVLGFEPGVKAAVVKYGSGFAKELNWGGVFGPLTKAYSTDPAGVDRWLALMDPKHGLANIRAATLLFSGTDDIFYSMPSVLETWRAISSQKMLVMMPNDSHTQVGNEEIPRQWFNHILYDNVQWPTVGTMRLTCTEGGIHLEVEAKGDLFQVEFWCKRMPKDQFRFGRGRSHPKDTVKWESIVADDKNGTWVATLPPPAAGEKICAYAMATSHSGTKACSDTVAFESPSIAGSFAAVGLSQYPDLVSLALHRLVSSF